jgi:folate-binding protein YgfZ
MLHDTPLRPQHEAYVQASAAATGAHAGAVHRPGAAVGQRTVAEVQYIPYGETDHDGGPTCQIVASFGDVEPEYAAVRRSAAALDSPHRGTLLVTGAPTDRRDFLNRMVTQELKDLVPGTAREGFWLNRKGRIDADLLLIELGDWMLIDVDIHQAAHTVKTLGEFIFAEDIEIKDVSKEFHHIAVHGKHALETVAAASDLTHLELSPLSGTALTIAGADVVVVRRDQTGEPGIEIIVPSGSVAMVWRRLVALEPSGSPNSSRVAGPSSLVTGARPIGWYALNIARIEAGTPLFNIDFGATNLPHETGILRQRVSFTKGCYLGQEIVARMESLGKPKRILVGLRIGGDLLPVAGAQVFAQQSDGAMGDEIGVVTSSTLSPMLSAQPIAFAMIKSALAVPGGTVLVNAEGQQAPAVVGPLQFWPPSSQPDGSAKQ